jgi:toxin-antitoxin system PIN domain toxin
VGLLDVNVLVALAWDSHVHHAAARDWFTAKAPMGWSTCPITESGFVRVSTNRNVLPVPVGIDDALRVLKAFRAQPGHQFLTDDVSIVDPDVPPIAGHRQVTDAHLITLARRHGVSLVTFDAGLAVLATGRDVELLTAL